MGRGQRGEAEVRLALRSCGAMDGSHDVVLGILFMKHWLQALLATGLAFAACDAYAQSFSERYDGTTVRLDWNYIHQNGVSAKSSGTFSVTQRGVTAPGMPTFQHRRIFSKGDGYGGTEEQVVQFRENGFKWDIKQRNNSLKLDFWSSVVVQFSHDGCTAHATSNYWKATLTCTIISRTRWQAKDTPEACQVVKEAIDEIRSLAPRAAEANSRASVRKCTRLTKVSRSIKGSACPSMFPAVDAALAEAGQYCAKRVPSLSETGVRG